MRIWLAVRIFFTTLFQASIARQVQELLATSATEATTETKVAAAPPPARARSEALTLLAALQREARFVDLVKEPLGNYADAQIGAAARDVLRDCASTLDRIFELEPILSEEEGADVEVPRGFDAGRFRLVGAVQGEPPFRGKLVHHGWQAGRCELPGWSGSQESATVVAAAEVEL